ncbi:MAG: hypothetical protein GY803_06760 [Chloroflexi bacterium]|nr:hypothetical protein [Chloroflexota bacterium]
MKIGRQKSKLIITPNRIWLGVLALVFGVGIALGERGISAAVRGYGEEVVARLRLANGRAELPTLTIDMPFANYNVLLDQRKEALNRGVFVAAESDFQTADIRLDDQTIPIRLRLRQGTAVHLGENDKWNFDIRTRNDQLLLGMSRFYLIDPADNNWLNEWAFMQTLQREDILAPRYQFVHLIFNGDDRGIYALQEGFGPELITAQGRTEGVIVEFDAARLWESIAYADGGATEADADPITNLTADDFKYFEVDTFRDAAVARDETLTAQKNTAIGLLRGLQNGELAAADVFDGERYGRFLALVDLWGAPQAASLVNLRYYYNPETNRLEPIGFNAAPVLDDSSQRISLDAAYNDPALQAAYVAAAQQFSQPEYLTALQADLDAAWQAQRQALNGAANFAAESQSLWEQLAQRQDLLRRSLHPLQSVFAYLGPPSLSMEAVIQVDVANVLNLPVEIIGFDIDGATFLEADRAWLQGEPVLLDGEGIVLPGFGAGETAVLQFTRFHLPLTKIIEQDSELDFNHEITIGVATRILGLEQTHLTPARSGYPDPIVIPNAD